MNLTIIRQRFRFYREKVSQLEVQVDDLNNQIEDQSLFHEEAISQQERRNRAYENERNERERQAESDRWYREGELQKATSDLERAKAWGDEWAEQRAIDKLKRLA